MLGRWIEQVSHLAGLTRKPSGRKRTGAIGRLTQRRRPRSSSRCS
jgi:hypothetical protein